MKIDLNNKETEVILKALFSISRKFREPCRDNGLEETDISDLVLRFTGSIPAKQLASIHGDINQFAETFYDNIFWEELAFRMASRDIYQKYKERFPDQLNDKEKEELKEIWGNYEKEFYENGLASLKLDQSI
ncbi:MAG: hypothetical protein C0601_10105 [Candidatus Muiribacterium halophilum]|uniref:Uncharacterized protein n=1 Tax=Muiribacterium halophilum TaxID=2053465 RepID=A0A2N5ZCR5_MUIH1|nr:MAG: hypothetical protein C0601_10105 [Candidatus Muirbacterium halophilum]